MREYLDFRIEISGLQENRFMVNATCPIGETRGSTEVVYEPELIDRMVGMLETRTVNPQEFLGLAATLGDMLFPGEVADLFSSAFPQQREEQKGIRLRLVIRDPQISSWPWEYAYISLGDREGRLSPYLALHPAVSIVRHEAKPVPQASLLMPSGRAFRVLAVSARDLPGLPTLAGMEAAVIGRVLQNGQGDGLRFELTLLDDPVTEAALQDALAGSFDLFQFSGHSISRRLLDGTSRHGFAL